MGLVSSLSAYYRKLNAESEGNEAADNVETAASQITDSINNAQNISNEAVDQIINTITSSFDTAVQNYTQAISQAQNELTSGNANTQDILNSTVSNANEGLIQGVNQAVNAITGSTPSNQAATAPQTAQTQTPQQTSGLSILPYSTKQTDAPVQSDIGYNAAEQNIIAGRNNATSALNNNYMNAQNTLASALSDIPYFTDPTKALNLINAGTMGAVGELNTYSNLGDAAAQKEAALAGALGPDAQQQAINEFLTSPGQQYLRDQQEQALVRNSAAIGGLGGGNVKKALQENAYGLASTYQQQALQNLASIATRGQTASTDQAGYRMTGGLAGADTLNNMNIAGLNANTNIKGQLSNTQANLGNAVSQIEQSTGLTLGQLAMQAGMTEAELLNQLAMNISNNTMSGGLAGAGYNNQNITNLSNLSSIYGNNLLNTGINQGTNLANVLLGQSGTNQNYALQQGQVNAASTLGSAAAYNNAYNQYLATHPVSGGGGIMDTLTGGLQTLGGNLINTGVNYLGGQLTGGLTNWLNPNQKTLTQAYNELYA